jgi:hypothetical protein
MEAKRRLTEGEWRPNGGSNGVNHLHRWQRESRCMPQHGHNAHGMMAAKSRYPKSPVLASRVLGVLLTGSWV